ncbi:hypothetical protein MNBD_BACTEROID03-1108, partial [hydrothermal vent metagenome]
MIKYTPANQLTLSRFSHPFDQELSPGKSLGKVSGTHSVRCFGIGVFKR